MVDEKKIFIGLLFVVVAVFLLSFSSTFTGFTVNDGSPDPEISIDAAVPGSTIVSSLNLGMNTKTLVHGKMEATGDAGSWISVPDEMYSFLPGLKTKIPVYIHVPEDTSAGAYSAEIAFLSVEDNTYSSQQIVTYIPVYIKVQDIKKEGYTISSFHVFDAEQGSPLYFEAVLKNEGNTEGDSDVHVELFNEKGKLVLLQDFNQHFFAFEEKEFVTSLDNSFSPGKYYARVSLGKETKASSFSLTAKGTLKQSGEILSSAVTVGDDKNINFEVYFKNTGELVLQPELDTKVIHNGLELQTFQTEKKTILPGDYEAFTYSYTDKELSGEYNAEMEIVSGNAVLAQESKKFYSKNSGTLQNYVIILFGVIIFVLLASHLMLSWKRRD
ncbi:hypothetical protein HZA98_03055 [Candidatus Woesearchaeota archaeon]|nr:hypothetical protein [Candidatus Woesearchaeota archaeon]